MKPGLFSNHVNLRLLQILFPVALLLIWEIIVGHDKKLDFVLGAPSGIYVEISSLVKNGDLFRHTFSTTFAAVFGCLIGTLLGTITGVLLSSSNRLFVFAEPYIVFIGSLPVFALGPVLIFWFGTGLLSKVFLVILVTYAISVFQSYEGAKGANQDILDLMKIYRASNLQVTKYVRIPSSVRWVISGLRINIGMALIGAVIGEFIASRWGLGHLIIEAEGLYNMDLVWAAVAMISLVALVLNFTLNALLKRYSEFLQV